jgi:hypothetical protein
LPVLHGAHFHPPALTKRLSVTVLLGRLWSRGLRLDSRSWLWLGFGNRRRGRRRYHQGDLVAAIGVKLAVLVQVTASDLSYRGVFAVGLQKFVRLIFLSNRDRITEFCVGLLEIAVMMIGIAHVEDSDRVPGSLVEVLDKICLGGLPVTMLDFRDACRAHTHTCAATGHKKAYRQNSANKRAFPPKIQHVTPIIRFAITRPGRFP